MEGDGRGVLVVRNDKIGTRLVFACAAGQLEEEGTDVEVGEVAEGGDIEAEINGCLEIVAHGCPVVYYNAKVIEYSVDQHQKNTVIDYPTRLNFSS